MLGGQKERREQIACSGNEDATIYKGLDQKRPSQTPGHTRWCQSMPNANISETGKTKSVWTHQEKKRRQPVKKYDGHGCTGEEKKGAT